MPVAGRVVHQFEFLGSGGLKLRHPTCMKKRKVKKKPTKKGKLQLHTNQMPAKLIQSTIRESEK